MWDKLQHFVIPCMLPTPVGMANGKGYIIWNDWKPAFQKQELMGAGIFLLITLTNSPHLILKALPPPIRSHHAPPPPPLLGILYHPFDPSDGILYRKRSDKTTEIRGIRQILFVSRKGQAKEGTGPKDHCSYQSLWTVACFKRLIRLSLNFWSINEPFHTVKTVKFPAW